MTTSSTVQIWSPDLRTFWTYCTLDLIRWEFIWPDLRNSIKSYVKSCTTCMCSKSQRHQPYGLLNQFPVPEFPWNSISMDFIEKLPPSSGHDTIPVIVDRLTKQSIFIPTVDTIIAPMLAQLFILHVFSKHGVPSHVTSDCGLEFVSSFFQTLGKALDMKHHFTSSYHPEGNGQTERMNQTLEQHLWVYCNYQQDNWSDLLSIAEFAYNNAPNTTTGISPFFANKGYHPSISTYLDRDLVSSTARSFVMDLEELHAQLPKTISAAQTWYSTSANCRQIPAPEFHIGDKVFVKSDRIHNTRPSKKLSEKFLGPFIIIAQAGFHSITLHLPESMCSIHPIFHISMITPATPNPFPGHHQWGTGIQDICYSCNTKSTLVSPVTPVMSPELICYSGLSF